MPGFMTEGEEENVPPNNLTAEGVENNNGESAVKSKKSKKSKKAKKSKKVEKLKSNKEEKKEVDQEIGGPGVLKPLKFTRNDSQWGWGISPAEIGDGGSSSEDDVEVVKAAVIKKLDSFMESSAQELIFSSKLNSFKRKVVHEVAEEAGLFHESEKKGKKRRLLVKKRNDIGSDAKKGASSEVEVRKLGLEEEDGDLRVETQDGELEDEKQEGNVGAEKKDDTKNGGQERAGVPKAIPGQEAVFVAGQRPGRGKLLLDEYDCTMKKKDKEGRVYRCTSYQKPPLGSGCTAIAKTWDVDGRIIYAETVGKHTTHGSKLAQVIANEIRFNARQNAIGTPGAKTRNLVTSIFKQAEEASTAAGVNLGPTIKEESMARFLRKAKAKQANLPKATELPAEIMKILDTEAPHLKEAVSGEKWLRFAGALNPEYDPEDPAMAEEPIALIFMSEHAKERFLQANAWAGDGTINIAPDPFKQLYSLHSVNGSGTVIPGVFALLPGKSTEWYNVMWKTVFETLGDWGGPDVFIQDQELAVTNSLVQTAVGSVKILYCWFHLRQIFLDHFRDSGMEKLSKTNPAAHKYYRYCNTLVFVPAQDVQKLYIQVVKPVLEELKDEGGKLPESAVDFSTFMETNYIGSYSESGRVIKPRADPQKWTQFESLLNDLPYTNNAVEGWHNGAHTELGINAGLWRFLTWLREEEARQKAAWWEDMTKKKQERGRDDGTGSARKRAARKKYDDLQSLARNYDSFLFKKSYMKAVWRAIDANYDA